MYAYMLTESVIVVQRNIFQVNIYIRHAISLTMHV